jgi:hypothetical protein
MKTSPLEPGVSPGNGSRDTLTFEMPFELSAQPVTATAPARLVLFGGCGVSRLSRLPMMVGLLLSGMIVIRSEEEEGELEAPPPETVAVFVIEAGALEATLTVTVMVGKLLPAASPSDRLQVTATTPTASSSGNVINSGGEGVCNLNAGTGGNRRGTGIADGDGFGRVLLGLDEGPGVTNNNPQG